MIEHRGITCLACKHADLQKYPDHAKTGYARCQVHEVAVFTRFSMSRNCKSYEAADEDQVKAREQWASKIKLPAWQR